MIESKLAVFYFQSLFFWGGGEGRGAGTSTLCKQFKEFLVASACAQ